MRPEGGRMNFEEFKTRERNSAEPIPTGIEERWQKRVIPNGWHLMGVSGAQAYLQQYGKGIGVQKVVHLAIKAEGKGEGDMARGFWIRAYEMSGGIVEPVEEEKRPVRSVIALSKEPEPTKPKRKKAPEKTYLELRRGPREML
jgi:hypothetical protein